MCITALADDWKRIHLKGVQHSRRCSSPTPFPTAFEERFHNCNHSLQIIGRSEQVFDMSCIQRSRGHLTRALAVCKLSCRDTVWLIYTV
ncbi:hypothetical protein CEXT_367891 [Caerostris extrusa]|uniref:Uncharacterized protein n=1 Tax=Caerostris extrusa TaxID=172846 RepID=A0AAV4M3W2_CAEEX|nr:hypothetical protein CEXT_367891 [Caerostris extrusa]